MSLFFIVGMPGAGKTYWARQVAEKYQIGFLDLDVYIEQREQMSIPDLFAQRGEAGFRAAEHEALKEVIDRDAEYEIIACGGGTPCYNDNLYLMKQRGTVIYLQATVPQLLNRVQRGAKKRPLLSGQNDLEQYLSQLLATREPVYMQADHILPVESISLTTFGQIIAHV
jgi:shikimate kinase